MIPYEGGCVALHVSFKQEALSPSPSRSLSLSPPLSLSFVAGGHGVLRLTNTPMC